MREAATQWTRSHGSVHDYMAGVRAFSGAPPLELERNDPDDVPTGVQPLVTVSAADFCNVELGPIDYLVRPMIVRGGMTTIYGPPKVGKTTLALHAIAAMLDPARPFLGGAQGIDGPALFLDLEQPRRVSIRRMQEAGASADLYVYRGAPPSLAQLLATIDAYGVKVVLIDSVTRWLMLESENDASEYNLKIGPALTAFQQRDITSITIDHAGKSDARDGRNLRGTTDKLAKVDIAVEIRAEGPLVDGRRRLSFVSREEIVEDVIVRLENGVYSIDGSPAVAAYRANREKIEKGIRFGHHRKETLADYLKVTTKTLDKWLEPLIAEGAVEATKANTRGAPIIYSLGSSQNFLGSSQNGRAT